MLLEHCAATLEELTFDMASSPCVLHHTSKDFTALRNLRFKGKIMVLWPELKSFITDH